MEIVIRITEEDLASLPSTFEDDIIEDAMILKDDIMSLIADDYPEVTKVRITRPY